MDDGARSRNTYAVIHTALRIQKKKIEGHLFSYYNNREMPQNNAVVKTEFNMKIARKVFP